MIWKQASTFIADFWRLTVLERKKATALSNDDLFKILVIRKITDVGL